MGGGQGGRGGGGTLGGGCRRWGEGGRQLERPLVVKDELRLWYTEGVAVSRLLCPPRNCFPIHARRPLYAAYSLPMKPFKPCTNICTPTFWPRFVLSVFDMFCLPCCILVPPPLVATPYISPLVLPFALPLRLPVIKQSFIFLNAPPPPPSIDSSQNRTGRGEGGSI